MRNHFYKTSWLFFIILIFYPSYSQNIVPTETLEKQLNAYTRQDTFRIDLINQLAWHSDIRVSMRDSLLNQSLQLSGKLHYLKGKAMALVIQSQFAQINEAVPMAQEALLTAKQSGDSNTLFWAYRMLGEAMLNTTDGAKALQPLQQSLQLAEALHNSKFITYAATALTDYYKQFQLNYPLALQWSLKALQTAEQSGNNEELGMAYRNIGAVYQLIGDRQKAIDNLQKALASSRQAGDLQTLQFVLNDIGEQYRITGKYAAALQAYSEAAKLIKDTFNIELIESNTADVYQRMGNDSLCFLYAFASLKGARAIKDTIGIAWIDYILSRAYLHRRNTDSALFFAAQGYHYSLQTQMIEFQRDNSEALANVYAAKNEYAKAFYYYKIFISARDSLINTEVTNQSNLQQYNYDLSKKQSQIAVLNKDKQLQQAQVQRQQYFLITLVTGLILVVTTLILLYRNSRQRKKDYALLQQEKLHVQLQRDQTNHALSELKSTQAQLIQSEKMASLGELTAGIAHEIQNPLNFVNNFSEVSRELIEEMQSERLKVKGERDEQLEEELLTDIKQNLEKINHHGKRADAIVKGMLQHSRQTKSVRELTDINALCDEYLRLSYHGLRAKDKSFNADFTTNFDNSIGKINIVPQDMGRVILNLFNNAFYATSEKQKAKSLMQKEYKPLVSVITRKTNSPSGVGGIEIVVKDNGNGIPKNVIDKIFQPFFTTKPTGQGTGLGLSLSYDIITKEHGGTIQVESEEGQGSGFVIVLTA